MSQKQQSRTRKLAGTRAHVKHPLGLIKRQFGSLMSRYAGLAKNAARVYTLFALVNLYVCGVFADISRKGRAPFTQRF